MEVIGMYGLGNKLVDEAYSWLRILLVVDSTHKNWMVKNQSYKTCDEKSYDLTATENMARFQIAKYFGKSWKTSRHETIYDETETFSHEPQILVLRSRPYLVTKHSW